MGLNEDLGDRENVGSAAVATQRAREARTKRKGDWMQTFTGRQFWPIDPRPEEVSIVDIAHSLSNQCRYAGHCKSFYSVAQHSVMVSYICAPEDALWGLLHDAAEAYLVDLPRPVKRFSDLGWHYKQIETRLMQVLCVRFNLPIEEPDSVSKADDVALMTEMRDLMGMPPAQWREALANQPLEPAIIPWGPCASKTEFLRRFEELSGK
jgi:hypothetical protein